MKLLSSLAQRIVKEVTHIVNEEVIVVDDQGVIIAASDAGRMGNFHEGAYISINNKEKFVIKKEDIERLKGVKPGLNLPIMINKNVIGVIGITGEPDQVVQFGQLIQRMTELIIQEAYTSERLESRYRGLETFVYEWIHSTELDQDVIERGGILGISMALPRMCVLFEIKPSDLDAGKDRLIEKEIIDQIRSQFEDDPEDLIVRWGNGRFVLLKRIDKEDHIKLLKRKLVLCQTEVAREQNLELFIGVGKLAGRPHALNKSYSDAKKALRASKKQHQIMYYEDLSLNIALAEITDQTRKELIQSILGGMLHDKELLHTLQTYMQCQLSLKETAKALHIHINTLHYRLKRISELTGRSLKDTEQLVSFFIALSFWYEFR
ncbi:CdaR family transcriptional regulator [Salipaludibacillus keqinensis]|uniref:CdaR family transcriptional regulator n=1 Tax=Salipaludibacillus keqinensis TaxID=2045207 RepID=A0A323TJ32_9BACI|nr:sugar diacid recognition domain-containing protein [Salipaludibacillus keqinensis]PYZ94206.1 CdaR family transcriptional regulator [Salipaludibacillus keqinensis]